MKLHKKYGFLWVTLFLFVLSLTGHWTFAWFSYVHEQQAHQQPIEISEYVVQTSRDTLENWQSEFLQLIWQVWGLAFLLFIGSTQSKEGEDRKEEKLDAILRMVSPEGQSTIKKLDEKYPKE
jgi:hypothetical protein